MELSLRDTEPAALLSRHLDWTFVPDGCGGGSDRGGSAPPPAAAATAAADGGSGSEYGIGDEATVVFDGFYSPAWRRAVYWLLVLATAGVLWYLGRWLPSLYRRISSSPCALPLANRVCLHGHESELTAVHSEREQPLVQGGSTKWFAWRHETWRWYDEAAELPGCSRFRPVRFPYARRFCDLLAALPKVRRILEAHRRREPEHAGLHNGGSSGGDNDDNYDNELSIELLQRAVFGRNEMAISVPNPLSLLVAEVLHPFYLFQLFSVVVWFCEDYWVYAVAIVVMSVLSAITSVVQTRRNLVQIRSIALYITQIDVWRDGQWRSVSSRDLVPGDVIAVTDGSVMACDALLLSGTCIVNESMLTGESMPVVKTPAPFEDEAVYEPRSAAHQAHTCFGGTTVLHTKAFQLERVVALVIGTGFSTTKGELVRSILYPRAIHFKFVRDSFIFIAILAVIAVATFVAMIPRMRSLGIGWGGVVLKSLDLVTIAIPPALPIALTIGIVFAVDRLRARSISCIAPSRINLAGLLDVICFDKTGTLTEEGLDVMGVREVSTTTTLLTQRSTGERDAIWFDHNDDLQSSSAIMQRIMATCHGLALFNGALVGDQLDLKMVQAIGWQMIEQHQTASTPLHADGISVIMMPGNMMGATSWSQQRRAGLAIVRRFDFSPESQCMSVIVLHLATNQLFAFCKGAPELIASICRPSTGTSLILTHHMEH